MRRLSIIFLLIAVVLSACGTVAEVDLSASVAVDRDQITRGIAVYRENYCGSCHALSIANTRGSFGPAHDDMVANAEHYLESTVYTGDATTVTDYIYESIVSPNIFYTPDYEATNHHMPAFGHLSEEDLNAMVYMLTHQWAYSESDN